MHPHHWVRSPGSYLLNDSGKWLRETESNRPGRLMRPDWGHSSYPATKKVRLFSCQRTRTLAQGEGLEPSPAGLESAMLPVTPTLRIKIRVRADESKPAPCVPESRALRVRSHGSRERGRARSKSGAAGPGEVPAQGVAGTSPALRPNSGAHFPLMAPH